MKGAGQILFYLASVRSDATRPLYVDGNNYFYVAAHTGMAFMNGRVVASCDYSDHGAFAIGERVRMSCDADDVVCRIRVELRGITREYAVPRECLPPADQLRFGVALAAGNMLRIRSSSCGRAILPTPTAVAADATCPLEAAPPGTAPPGVAAPGVVSHGVAPPGVAPPSAEPPTTVNAVRTDASPSDALDASDTLDTQFRGMRCEEPVAQCISDVPLPPDDAPTRDVHTPHVASPAPEAATAVPPKRQEVARSSERAHLPSELPAPSTTPGTPQISPPAARAGRTCCATAAGYSSALAQGKSRTGRARRGTRNSAFTRRSCCWASMACDCHMTVIGTVWTMRLRRGQTALAPRLRPLFTSIMPDRAWARYMRSRSAAIRVVRHAARRGGAAILVSAARIPARRWRLPPSLLPRRPELQLSGR